MPDDKLPNDASVFAIARFDRSADRVNGSNAQADLERAVELDPRNIWLLPSCRSHLSVPAALPGGGGYLGSRSSGRARRSEDACVARASRFGITRRHATMREAIESILTEDPSAVDAIAEQWLYLALCRRDAAEMTQRISFIACRGIIRLRRANASLLL